jgi:mono/diheme cytochrome c family protein
MRSDKIIFVVALLFCAATFFAFAKYQKFDLKASIERGKEIYTVQCMSCHMENGEGMESVFPPLAKSDYLLADTKRSIHQTLYGMSGEIKVNGVTYNGEMPAFELSDTEASDVLNYIRNSWGNKGNPVTPEDVRKVRTK